MVSASCVLGASNIQQHITRSSCWRVLCASSRVSETSKNNPAAARRNRRLDCFVASAFRLRSLSYGGQVARCNDALLTPKTNRGLRQGADGGRVLHRTAPRDRDEMWELFFSPLLEDVC